MFKLSLGMNLQQGPWGGGNQVGRSLAAFLTKRSVDVCFDLAEPGLDIILLAEPRKNLTISAYSEREVFAYLRRNPRTLVVHRVNECDERKGSRGVNRRILRANMCADHTVFVSRWLQELYVKQGLPCRSSSVIHNGSDQQVFHPGGYNVWDGEGPLKLVTHHWGGHWMKGFDIYQRLDKLLDKEPFKGRVSFTYIGNLPQDFEFRNARYVQPLKGEALADMLRSNHVYLTASRNEPGPNHQNEGASCGLPLLYLDSGPMDEYCSGFGLVFTENDFEEKLLQMMQSYRNWVTRMPAYPNTAEKMCGSYFGLCKELLAERDRLVRERSRGRLFQWMLRSLVAR